MRNKKLLLMLIGLIIGNGFTWWIFLTKYPGSLRDLSGLPAPAAFNRASFAPVRAIREFPPIIDPPHVAAEEANQLKNNELVLGIEFNGEARAYPINMLTGPRREIFNDELGGRRIAATW